LRDLIKYCRVAKLNPEQLIRERRKDKMNGTHIAEQRLDSFIATAELPHQAKWRIAISVKSFFAANYEDLSKGSGKITFLRQKPIRVPTVDEIEAMCRHASLRDEVLIKILRDTGMREGSLSRLKWSHLWDELFSRQNGDLIWDRITAIHVRLTALELKGKYSEVEQHCFLTPETVNLILEYKTFREKRGEKVGPESSLFTRDRKDTKGKYRPLTRRAIIYVVTDASSRIGKAYSPHDFRRFTQTAFERAQILPNWTRKLLGRKIRGEESPYSRPKIDDLREAFKKAIPYLTRGEVSADRVKNLEDELTRLKESIQLFRREGVWDLDELG